MFFGRILCFFDIHNFENEPSRLTLGFTYSLQTVQLGEVKCLRTGCRKVIYMWRNEVEEKVPHSWKLVPPHMITDVKDYFKPLTTI